ncbi:MAG: hypothetical protein QM725_18665 [Lacibacter sp.]
MANRTPEELYQNRIAKLKNELSVFNRKKSRLAWLRFFALIGCIAGSWLLWPWGISIVFMYFPASLFLFLFIVKIDLNNKNSISNHEILVDINLQEIDVLHHKFTHLPGGNEFQPADHSYANDLDIFGKSSLYQYINRTTSQQGNQLMASWLLNSASATLIHQRQAAVKELEQNTEWRQQLQAFGLSKQITTATQNKIEQWLQQENKFIDKLIWKAVRILLPFICISIIVLYAFDIVPSQWFNLSMLLFLAIAFGITKWVMPLYLQLNKIASEIGTLKDSVEWIEKAVFKSELLKDLQSSFVNQRQQASISIHQLRKIFSRLDYRLNPVVFIPLNTILLWDLQQVLSLEKWKQTNRHNISNWFHSLAQFEVLSSIANLAANQPYWCYPEPAQHDYVFLAKDLGHPLIEKEKLVTSSFSTNGNQQISLVTGSNMAGKSTFLRSVGTNIVLSHTGAPVCASSLTISPMRVISSMRISDNLEESTSTFYAELKKLKQIIEAVSKHEHAFLLLDEILRGTNSKDRHTGSEALIKQLLRDKAAGIVATHDLELTNLAAVFPHNIHNYHFDAAIKNEELYFDYKLKEGICSSMNASLLMKKIGIEL